MTDRTTKILLGAIALGLWANAGPPLVRSTPAYASDDTPILRNIDNRLSDIDEGIRLLANGACRNKKLC